MNDGQITSSPRPIAESVEDDDDRIRPVGDTDRLGHLEIVGRLALEGRNVRAEDELPALEHVGEGLLELRNERLVLSLDVDESDLHGTPVYRASPAAPRRR